VYNNSLRFTDPTGHFTEQAIKDYLIGKYGEKLGMTIYNEWQDDAAWWSIMRTAHSGDILLTTYSMGAADHPAYFSFSGEGESSLFGITRTTFHGNPISFGDVKPPYGTIPPGVTLEDIRSGSYVSNYIGPEGKKETQSMNMTWAGILLYHNNNYSDRNKMYLGPQKSYYIYMNESTIEKSIKGATSQIIENVCSVPVICPILSEVIPGEIITAGKSMRGYVIEPHDLVVDIGEIRIIYSTVHEPYLHYELKYIGH
jgi:hypothetical protein